MKKKSDELQVDPDPTDADYDGYYDDRIPEDAGTEFAPQKRNLARQLIPLAIGFLIIIAASIAVLYLS